MKVTIKDIANKAGISPASVSRILTNRGRFNADTAVRVRAIATAMGYLKNQSAADLAQKQSHVVGVLVPTEHTNFADEIIKGMQAKAHELNYELLVTFIESDEVRQLQTVQSLLSRQVLAIFMLAIDPSNGLLEMLTRSDVQLISISNQLNTKIPSISSDNYAMMHQVVDFLYQKGHRDIALIGSSEPDPIVARLRRQGFIEALAKHNLPYHPEFIWGDKNNYETGLAAIKHFKTPLPFTAAIGSADIISVGLLNGAKDAGIVVPTDFSIISVDGTELTQLTRPPLNTVQQNFHLMGSLAITALVEQTLAPSAVLFTETKLIAGGTVEKIIAS